MRHFLVALALGLAACLPSAELPEGTSINCAHPSECPSGYRCDEQFDVCLPNSADSSAAPSITSSSVSPSVAGRGITLQISFTPSEPLLVGPAVRLVAGSQVIPLTVMGRDGAAWTFSYLVTGDEVAGAWSVLADLAGQRGGVLRDAELGTLVIDFTPPVIEAVDVDQEVQAHGTRWVDTTSLTLRPAAEGDVPATVLVGGDVDAEMVLDYAPELAVELTPGDGPKTLVLSFRDAVGNAQVVPLTLVLETTSPVNGVTIRIPESAETWVNADAVPVVFGATGTAPEDFASFVVSRDAGATWSPVAVPGYYVADALAQDATTALWLREADVFGNTTPAPLQGVVVIHEDSTPPGPPVVPRTLHGHFGTRTGLMIFSSAASPNEKVRFEVSGPSSTQVVEGSPYAVLPEILEDGPTSYGVAAVDRAGNRSATVLVTVFDDALEPAGLFCMDCVFHSFSVDVDRVAFYMRDDDQHAIYVCQQDEEGGFPLEHCSSVFFTPAFLPTTSYVMQANALRGRNFVFEDISQNLSPDIRAVDFGADRMPGGGDDGTMVTINANARCVGATEAAMVYGGTPVATKRPLVYRSFGADGIVGTADDNTVTLVSAASVTGINPCDLAFDGRHIVWRDDRSGSEALYLYDLGGDGVPNGNDLGEQPISNATLNSFSLQENRLVLQIDNGPATVTDLGPDGSWGTGDYATYPLELSGIVVARAGRKLLVDQPSGGVWPSQLLYDLENGLAATVNDGARSGGFFRGALGPNYAFGLFDLVDFGSRLMSFNAAQDPFVFHAADVGYAIAGGAWSGDYLLLGGTLVDLAHGGTRQLFASLGAASLPDPDMDHGRVVWRDSAGALWLYEPGADGLVGSADDVEPVQLFPRAGSVGSLALWPRIDGNRIVWAELTASWFGSSAFESQIVVLDLGADGSYDAGIDLPTPLALAGMRPLLPDLEGGTLVFLHRAGTACPEFRGGPDEASCATTVYAASLDGTTTLLDGTAAARGQLQLTEGMAMWSELRGAHWLARGCAAGSCSPTWMTTVDTVSDVTSPVVHDGNLIYLTQRGPAVIGPGADGVLGRTLRTISDDILRRPSAASSAVGSMMQGPRLRLASDDGILVSGGVVPLFPTTSVGGTDETQIPDAASLSIELDVDAPPSQQLDDLSVEVVVDHGRQEDLSFSLRAPNGEEVYLGSGAGAGEASYRFSFASSGALFAFYGQPVAGTWTLIIGDEVGGESGSVLAWRLESGS